MKLQQQNNPLNILLADDDADDRYFFGKLLREMVDIATHFTAVHDGEQLMEYLSENMENLPDVLFLDLSMPVKSGFESLAEIRDNPKLDQMPIAMFSTAFPSNKFYEQGMIKTLFDLGANHFLRKTSDCAQIKLAVQNILVQIIEKKT